MRAALSRASSSVEDNWRGLLKTGELLFGSKEIVCPTLTTDPPFTTRLCRLRFPSRRFAFEPEGMGAFPRPDVMDLVDLRMAFFAIWQYDSMVYQADLLRDS